MTAEAKSVWLEIETYSLLGVLTGSDRQRLGVVKPKAANPFDEF